MRITRRKLMQTGALAGGALFLAGCGGGSQNKNKVAGGNVNITKNTDVLIVGCGGAGIFAAYALIKAGIKPIIIEKASAWGGDSVLNCGLTPAMGTKHRARNGYNDNIDDLAKAAYDRAVTAGGRLPKINEIVTRYTAECLDIITDEFNVEFLLLHEGHTNFYHVAKPSLGNSGRMLAPIVSWLTSNGTELMLDTKGVEFILDDKDVAVGMRVFNNVTKQYTDIGAKKIIIATGGYVSNQEFVAQYLPKWAKTPTNTVINMGDSVILGDQIGAGIENMDKYMYLISDNAQIVTWGCWGWTIQVLPDGKRFVREEDVHDICDKTVGRGYNMFWTIYDQQALDSDMGPSIKACSNKTVTADNFADLAKLMDVDPATLVSTMDTWNNINVPGKSDPFGRRMFVALNKPPYYAVMAVPCRYKTQGGLLIDDQCRVLTPNMDVIPNVYAIGAATGALNTNFGPCVATGLYAGRLIAGATV